MGTCISSKANGGGENPRRSFIMERVGEMLDIKQIEAAEKCLIDNGVEVDEAGTVLQALGYILLDAELYPDKN